VYNINIVNKDRINAVERFAQHLMIAVVSPGSLCTLVSERGSVESTDFSRNHRIQNLPVLQAIVFLHFEEVIFRQILLLQQLIDSLNVTDLAKLDSLVGLSVGDFIKDLRP